MDWQLEGMKFALGPTIATTRTRLNGFGGYPVLENRPADDLLVGRLIDEQGFQVLLLRYAIDTVCDYGSLSELLHKRLRWIVVMRPHAPVGASRFTVDPGIAVVASGGGDSSYVCVSPRLRGRLPGHCVWR